MIIEVRTYGLKPGSLAEVEKRFGEALPGRQKLSKLAAFWHTEVGPLNEITHIWTYDSFEQRIAIRAEAIKIGVWPPKTSEFIVSMQTEVFLAAPFSPPLEPREVGPLFEIRSYTLRPRRTSGGDRALGRCDRRAGQAVTIGRCLVLGDRWAEQMGPHLGLQGRYRTAARPGGGGRTGHLAAAQCRSRAAVEAGKQAGDASLFLTTAIAKDGAATSEGQGGHVACPEPGDCCPL